MATSPTWNFQDPASKDRLLSVLHAEIDAMFELTAEPARWHTPTACRGWEIRDMIGHLLDATGSYLTGFDIARHGGAAPEPVGVVGMAKASDRAARAFRSVPREELLARLREDTDRLIHELESLSDADWSGLMVPDAYMGPLPAMIVAAGLLGGYTVHGWDIRQGLGAPHALAGDAADLLVPFVFLLWWATADTTSVDTSYTIRDPHHRSQRRRHPIRRHRQGHPVCTCQHRQLPHDPRIRPCITHTHRIQSDQRRHHSRRSTTRHRLPLTVRLDLTHIRSATHTPAQLIHVSHSARRGCPFRYPLCA